MMKYMFFLIFCILCFPCYSQLKTDTVTHYLFSEFTRGIVLLKSGVSTDAYLNYNSLTEEMVFDKKGEKLSVDKLDLIDTVFIEGRKFFPIIPCFVELIYKSRYELYAENKCRIKDPGKPSGYGGTSKTGGQISYSSFMSGNQKYELKLPEGYETKPFVEYWLKKDGEINKFVNTRQLYRMFPEKNDLIKSYKNKHDVNYDDRQSIIELIKYLEVD